MSKQINGFVEAIVIIFGAIVILGIILIGAPFLLGHLIWFVITGMFGLQIAWGFLLKWSIGILIMLLKG